MIRGGGWWSKRNEWNGFNIHSREASKKSRSYLEIIAWNNFTNDGRLEKDNQRFYYGTIKIIRTQPTNHHFFNNSNYFVKASQIDVRHGADMFCVLCCKMPFIIQKQLLLNTI